MDISVIIVNFNVKYFAEHGLRALMKSGGGLETEIFLVDNHSADGSLDYLEPLFPGVRFIACDRNRGFGSANNLAARLATGKYLLLLNPDTIVPEDCLEKCFQYMEARPDAGALGCRMVDGKGRFLPESKRSFPSPLVSFYKISGLAALFPRSRIFSRYHLGYLSEYETHSVDVLAGAFMLIRRQVWEEVGGFDEDFFMYGEDIDLSYRIHRAGYQNYYYAGTTILHFKGESTRKGSLNYVKMFYQAMSIFAKKHLEKGQAALFNSCIQLAIWFRAGLAILARVFNRVRMPLVDFFILLGSLALTNQVWLADLASNRPYQVRILSGGSLVYTGLVIGALYFCGAYERVLKESSVTKGMVAGTILILAVYGLLPHRLRFPYSLILFSGLTGLAALLVVRRLFRYLGLGGFEYRRRLYSNTMILGTREEAEEVRFLLESAGLAKTLVGTISPEDHKESGYYIGHASHLRQLAGMYKASEIIFCAGRLRFKDIIAFICGLELSVSYKIHTQGSLSIIGASGGILDQHVYSLEDHFQISTSANRRNKRVLDILFAGFLLVTFPVHILFVRNYSGLLRHCWEVLSGRKTWIGYLPGDAPVLKGLPPLRPGVLAPLDPKAQNGILADNRQRINQLYARQYMLWDDLLLMVRMYPRLGGPAKGEGNGVSGIRITEKEKK